MTPKIPTRFEPHSDTELRIMWNSGESYTLPYIDIRFECPCASCVDEKTGIRVLRRESIPASIRPKGAQVVGQYALQIHWNDGHSTGMYHFDRLFELCQKYGHTLATA